MKRYAKKVLSICLAILMCLTVAALDWSALVAPVPVAEAATAGQYAVKVTISYTLNSGDGNIFSDSSFNSNGYTLYGKNKNGRNSQGTIASVSGLGKGTHTKEVTTDYFPTSMSFSFNYGGGATSYQVTANITIQVKKNGTYTTVGSKNYQGGKSGWFSSNGGSTTVTCSGAPSFDHVTISGGQSSIETNAVGGADKETSAFTVTPYDNYGVVWDTGNYGGTTTFAWEQSTKNYTRSSLTASSGESTKLKVQAPNANVSQKTNTIKVTGTYGSTSKYTTTNVTIIPKYKISYDAAYNYGAADFSGVSSPIYQNNTSTSSATITVNSNAGFKGKKNDTTTSGKGDGQANTGDWTFVGWNTSNTAHTGTKNGNISSIGYNQTLYAIYSKDVTANFYYFDNSGNLVKQNNNIPSNKQTAYNRDTQVTFDLPTTDASSRSFKLNGIQYTFVGWKVDDTSAGEPTVGNSDTTNTRTIRAASYNYYAVYKGTLKLSYDVNSIGPNRTSSSSVSTVEKDQYLVASGSTAAGSNRQSITFEVSSVVPTRTGMESFLGWRLFDTYKNDNSPAVIPDAQRDSENESGLKTGGNNIAIDQCKTLLAIYKDRRQTVKFYDYKGDVILPVQSVRYDHTAQAPNLSTDPAHSTHADMQNHYVFNQWTYSGGSVFSTDTKILQDQNIFATYFSYKHVLDNNEVGAPTCESGVNFSGTCIVCGTEVTVTEAALGHKWILDGYVRATCTRAGNNGKAICLRCGKTSYEEHFDLNEETGAATWTDDTSKHLADGSIVPIQDHIWIQEGEGEAATDKIFVNYGTCTVAGYKYKQCKFNENHILVTERLDPLPHGYELDENGVPVMEDGEYVTTNVVTVPAKEATCTADGNNAYTKCNVCGAYTEQPVVIPATGHALKHFGAVPATCKMEGNIEYWYCINCGKYFSDAEAQTEIVDDDPETVEIPLTAAEKVKLAKVAHTLVETAAAEATCVLPGHTAGVICTVCGFVPEGSTASAETPALGHVWEREGFAGYASLTGVHHDSETPCSVPGYTTYTCTYCDETIDIDDPLSGHTLTPVAAKAATCSEEGNVAYWECSVCGKLFSDENGQNETTAAQVILGKTDHTWQKKAGSTAVEPTCTEPGSTAAMECSVCHAEKASETIPATGHVKTDWIVTQNATCTDAGSRSEFCAKCRVRLTTEVIPALGHDYVEKEAKAATCVEDGNTAGTVCTRCGDTNGTSYEVLPATGNHTYGDAVVTEATCAKEGTKVYTCSVCGNVKVETIDKLAHTEVVFVEAKPATCEAAGNTAGTKCSECGEILVNPTLIPKAPHEAVDLEDIPATCSSKGVTGRKVCVNCGKVISNGTTTDMLRHVWGDTPERTEPTCTANGSSVRTCTLCGKQEVTVILALNHQPAVDAAVAPTCTADGLTEGSHCRRCGITLVAQTVVPALDHEYNAVVTPPTCEAEGYTTHTCIRCPETYTDNTVNALGHDWVKDEDRCIAPTCQKAGSDAYKCTRCTERKRETLPAIDHQFDVVGTDATCTQGGYNTFTCTMCGYTYEEPIQGPLGHVYENGVCVRCGEADPNYNPDTPTEPSTPATSEKCEKCGLNHNGRTGLWKQDGFFCKLLGFFRSIFKMFR